MHSGETPPHHKNTLAHRLGFSKELAKKMRRIFSFIQEPTSVYIVINGARTRGYFEDGGDMFLLLAHRFQSMTEGAQIEGNTALAVLSDNTLRILGTHRAEVQQWIDEGIMHILRDVLEHARSSQIRLGEEKITGKLRGFLEGDEEIFLNEIKRLGFSASSLDQLTPDITERLGTSQQELLFFRKIGKIHRATWLIKQAREDGHLLGDDWEGLMTYLTDAQGITNTLILDDITDDTLSLAGLSREEVQGWFRHIPG